MNDQISRHCHMLQLRADRRSSNERPHFTTLSYATVTSWQTVIKWKTKFHNIVICYSYELTDIEQSSC
jgi:hypothetical protein